MNSKDVPVLSFVARSSGTGKTTLLEKVIKILKEDGMRIAVIKHDAHEFEIDKPGKDSWRFAQAGADIVAISSAEKIAIIEKVNEEKKLDEIIGMLSEVDLILTEGFKMAGNPKIEVVRSSVHSEMLFSAENLLAVVSDIAFNCTVPCYHIDDIQGVVGEVKRFKKNFDDRKFETGQCE